ncbi:hypothetical protein Glove_87g266 [Diversispora epigaea]|uniref:Uncharacterized protein n=1 Tax=Diversispora epigaea TaxID=1348612 RepID=A0A397JAF9_9GLOM|nr:hypothetical protein Glove_87g266 [Diversispora epigaea]
MIDFIGENITIEICDDDDDEVDSASNDFIQFGEKNTSSSPLDTQQIRPYHYLNLVTNIKLLYRNQQSPSLQFCWISIFIGSYNFGGYLYLLDPKYWKSHEQTAYLICVFPTERRAIEIPTDSLFNRLCLYLESRKRWDENWLEVKHPENLRLD